MSDNKNTELWDSVAKTDKNHTKSFSRKGGFKGTAIKPYYLIRRATEVFGPIGIGWGFTELEHNIANGIWFSKVRLWYVWNEKMANVEQWGATEFVGQNKNGTFVDEECAKKSMTDAITKCLSYIGFAGDVHLGLFDDSKYMSGEKDTNGNPYSTSSAMKDRYKDILASIEAAETWDDLKSVWRTNLAHIKAMKNMDEQFYTDLERAKDDRKRAIEDINVAKASFGETFVNTVTGEI